MDQTLAVWIVILLAFGTASLPFLLQRPLLALPWAQPGEPERPAWLRVLESAVFFSLLAAWCLLTVELIGGAIIIGSDLASAAMFLGKLLGVGVAAVLLLAYPGWRMGGVKLEKPVLARILEVLVLYAMVGAVGFAFEANIGNRFAQGWEFYAITLSLYLVLAYPGFVLRYLLHRRRQSGSAANKAGKSKA